MSRKDLLLTGIAATSVYVLTVILGGLLWPGYNHIAQFVSELIGAGAPNKTLLDPLFGLYNLLTAAFAWALLIIVREQANALKRGPGIAGALTLLAEGIFGLATLFFPQDAMGSPVTATGTMHIVLAGLSSLTTMGAMLLMGLWFHAHPTRKNLGLYSFISVTFVFVCGGMAAALGAGQSPISGLMERLTIGGFLQWMAVTSVVMAREKRG